MLAKHTKLAAGVALHGLSLAVASEVVGSAALVAGGRARTASEATAETAIAATGRTRTTHAGGVGAVAGKMADHPAAVAAAAGAGTAQAERGAVGLDVAETLAVIALLGCCYCCQSTVVSMLRDLGSRSSCETRNREEVGSGDTGTEFGLGRRTLSGTGMRTSIGLVAGLFACGTVSEAPTKDRRPLTVVAKALRGRAHL